MKPLNQKERSTLYWQFLLLYIVSIVLVICAVSFYYGVNDKEVEVLKAQKEKFTLSEKMPIVMNDKIHRLDSLLGALTDPKKSSDMIEGDISRILNDLPVLGRENTSSFDTLTDNIRKNYFAVLDDKRKIRESSSATGLAGELDQKVTKLQKDLDDCTKKNDMLELKLSIQK